MRIAEAANRFHVVVVWVYVGALQGCDLAPRTEIESGLPITVDDGWKVRGHLGPLATLVGVGYPHFPGRA